MDIKEIQYLRKSEIVRYKGVYFKSMLEGTWADFFDELVYDWEYEPTFAYKFFQGWLPDFAIWVKEGDSPIFCEVKPINLRILPQEIVSKVNQCDKVDGMIVGLLGLDPIVSRNPMSMGWVSKRRDGNRKWLPWTVNDMELIKSKWEYATKQFTEMSDTSLALANLSNEIAWEYRDDA